MSNYAEYILALKDQMSAPLKAIVGTTQQVQNVIKETQIKTSGLGDKLKQLAENSKSFFDSSIDKAIELREANAKIIDSLTDADAFKNISKEYNIDPKMQQQIMDLEKSGKTATAQFMLLDEVQKKTAEDNANAFKENPLSLFTKTLDDVKAKIGEFGLKAKEAMSNFVSPYIKDALDKFTQLKDNAIGGLINKLQEGNPVVVGFTAVVGALVGAYYLMQFWSTIAAAKTALWTAAQWLLNSAFFANPLTWIIGSIILLIGVIGFVIYKYKGWGEAWYNLMDGMQFAWLSFKENFNHTWLAIKDLFLSGIDHLKIVWFEFMDLMGDKTAAASMNAVKNKMQERANELTDSQQVIDVLNDKTRAAFSKIGLNDTGKTLGDFFNAGKNLIKIPSLPGADATIKTIKGDEDGGKTALGKSSSAVATGGQKNTTIHIQIGKQIESLIVHAQHLPDAANKIYDAVTDAMTRSIAMSQSLAQ